MVAGVYVAGFTDPSAVAPRTSIISKILYRIRLLYSGIIAESLRPLLRLYDFCDHHCPPCPGNFRTYINFITNIFSSLAFIQTDFRLARFHQQTIQAFLKATSEQDDQSVIKVVAQKTKELLDTLKKLTVSCSLLSS